ncbi:hypothetical protein M427DRAFT_60296 [Gonapodya prolifera JEL478]|uniref:Uncharacterized protein n=1 Tax=Gonapodya prolifera (strain JEL478) TaxID=1344416 RepID=A0A139A5K6_GONPJ|nr:hypothetical protein M427DRAFT_60296 [Gonapodya prolifera JEL478]|eukprot:KXS11683.1 hypothetical protein M427DRAFT_60296 [Gonapodya prolifera JEL478]
MEPNDEASGTSGDSDISDFDLLDDCAFDILSWSTSGQSVDGGQLAAPDLHDSGECSSCNGRSGQKAETLISLRVPSPSPSPRGSSSPTRPFTQPPHARHSPTPRTHPVPETPSTDSEKYGFYDEPSYYPHKSWQIGKSRKGLPSDKTPKGGSGRCTCRECNPKKFKARCKRKGFVGDRRKEIRLMTEWEPDAIWEWTGPVPRRRWDDVL